MTGRFFFVYLFYVPLPSHGLWFSYIILVFLYHQNFKTLYKALIQLFGWVIKFLVSNFWLKEGIPLLLIRFNYCFLR